MNKCAGTYRKLHMHNNGKCVHWCILCVLQLRNDNDIENSDDDDCNSVNGRGGAAATAMKTNTIEII